jgi:CRP-like cAMP-binding protein
MSPRKYDNKEIIFAKGDEANYVYFIIVGKVIG